MNRLIIIGNGFDLAHGLKTSCKDFILYYLSKVWGKLMNGSYEDRLLKVKNSCFPHFSKKASVMPDFTEINFCNGCPVIYK